MVAVSGAVTQTCYKPLMESSHPVEKMETPSHTNLDYSRYSNVKFHRNLN